MESLEIILEKSPLQFTESEKLRLAEEKNERYRRLLYQMTPADMSPAVRETLRELRGAGPVSYTHLDVYKRQVWSVWRVPTRPLTGTECS